MGLRLRSDLRSRTVNHDPISASVANVRATSSESERTQRNKPAGQLRGHDRKSVNRASEQSESAGNLRVREQQPADSAAAAIKIRIPRQRKKASSQDEG